MTLTKQYSALHRAFSDVAADCNLQGWDVRVLLALDERGGTARSDQLEKDLHLRDGSAIRRSLGTLRDGGYIAGDGRPGRRTVVTLLPVGQAVADRVRAAAMAQNQRALAA